MRLNCSIFDQPLAFDQNTYFSKDFCSPAGAFFTATTLPGEQILTIAPKPGGVPEALAELTAIEHVASLPIADFLWRVELNPSGDVTLISIGGEKPEGIVATPKKAISVDGEKPEGIVETPEKAISIGGEDPEGMVDLSQVAISGAGERPETDTSEIKLINGAGSWRIEPDPNGQFLNVSFKNL